MFIFYLYFVIFWLIFFDLVVPAGICSEHHILADLIPPECHGLRVRVVETVCAEGSEVLLKKVHQRPATLV